MPGLPPGRAYLLDGVLPQEWIVQLDVWWVRLVADGARARRCWRRRSRRWSPAGASGARGSSRCRRSRASACSSRCYLLTGSLEIFLLRYIYPALPPLALGAGFGLAARRPAAGARRRALGVGTLAVVALWVDLAGFFWFNDIGAKLGI